MNAISFLFRHRGLRLAFGSLITASAALAVQVSVTVRRTSPENGIWFVNPQLFVHDGSFDLFDAGSAASAALESAAEDGNASLVQVEFGVEQPDGHSAVLAGPFAPGRSVTRIFDLDPSIPAHRYFSYASMLIPSNDAFFGNDSPMAYPLFDDEGNVMARSIPVWGAAVWDAGTEVNDELPATTAFLAQAAPNTGTTENGVVALHPGFMAAGQGGILDATSLAPGQPVTFQSADFTANGYQIAEIIISVVDGESTTPSRLLNLSSRGRAGTGDDTQVVGFVVSSGTEKQVLVRAVGPGLADFNIADFLADPVLTVFDADGVEMATNDNWVAADVTEATATVGAFTLPENSADAALLLTLPAGAYTAQVSNNGDTEGVTLVEIYEVGR
ncbi:spondin domain-containing protein [Actomonas aquatica]|uniref:Spondin domain-containing protein n=1 Tax=Actomonas aquatica TaxID=2866162 RepID=A0ABZ1C4I6_9BACT|nr:spondin domain-containing protein [Opitutus sp. WL0086]WRQ86312.1 spondin domain-containing protein [Opitutus sp. WL0086]